MKIKGKELFKDKNKLILFSVLIIILLFIDIIFYSKFIYNERSYYTEDHLQYDNKYELDGEVTIEQTFIANGNNLEAVALGFDKEFRTYNDEEINIKIINMETNEIIGEYDNIYQAPVQEWKVYKFEFEKQKESEGKEYKIVITYSNGTKGNALLYDSQKNFDKGTLTVNGNTEEANISFELYYSSKYATGIWTVAMIGLNIVAIVTIWLLTYKKITLEKTFLLITILIGIIYVFAMPIYRGHDEHAHFFRAYEISKGILNTRIEDGMSLTDIPKAFTEITEGTDRYYNESYYKDVIGFLGTTTQEGETITENGSYMAVYSPIPYIPQAITIAIVDLFTNNIAIMFYVARLVNLLVTIFILYLALKIIPFGKKIIFLIAIIPTTMTQMASMSPDATTLSTCILFVAYIVKLLYEKKNMTKKEVATITVLGSIVALCKIVYIPFILLTLLIPRKRYENKKRYIQSILLMIVLPVLINLIWLGIAGTHLALIDNNKSSVQTINILTNIPEYIRTVLYTVQYSFGTLINELFGGALLHNDVVTTGMIITIPMIVLFLLEILLDEEIKGKLNTAMKWTFGGIIFVILCLIVTSLYVQWSPLKWFYVSGIQGRYFLPLLLPLVILLGQNQWVEKIGKVNLKSIIALAAILINVYALAQIVITFI